MLYGVPSALVFLRELPPRGALHRHHLTQHLAEVCRLALVVRYGLVVERYGQRRERVALFAGYGAGGAHAVEHQIAARKRVVIVAYGRVARGGVHHAHEYGRLLYVQLVGRLAEEGAGGGLDAVGVRAVCHRVEIHGGDLLLGIVVFELEGRDPLLELRLHELERTAHLAAVACRVAREEVLGQLLGYGAAAALRVALQHDGLDTHAEERRDIDTRVVAETHILGGDERRHNGRYVIAVEGEYER